MPGTRRPLAERYQLTRRVGRGGMGEVWQATDLSTGASVAVKLLLERPDPTEDDDSRARLLREAKALQRIDHPNVVRYLDVGFDEEQRPFLVLQWLEGEDLAERQARAPLDLEQSLQVTRQVLAGLAASHAEGVTHRDVKPSNVIISAEPDRLEARLVDFGVARVTDLTRLTRTGTLMGTPHYLAPEQVRGAGVHDALTDIYAAGVMLYELTTGQLPFDAREPMAILLKIVSETPPWPTELRPDLPSWLEAVILKAMRRAPGDRFASAEAMRAALSPDTAVARAASAQREPAATARERRLVTMLSIDILDESSNPARVRQEVERAGGICELLPGRVFGLFGLEETAGDEAYRAVSSGLTLARLHPGSARVVATTIHVTVGDGIRLDTEELDQATGARPDLSGGKLLVDRATRELVQERFTLERHGELFVVIDPTARLTTSRRVLGATTPTVGREAEVAAVRATFERAVANGEPEDVLVHGEPGIGKSRLLDELLPLLRGRCSLCLEGRPASSHGQAPYALFGAAIARAAGIRVGQPAAEAQAALDRLIRKYLERPAPEVQDFLATVAGFPADGSAQLQMARGDPKMMHRKVVQALVELLGHAGRTGPVALCLDDLQWADTESLRLCADLLAALDDTPLFLLGACRPELLRREAPYPTDEATLVPLRPLGRRALSRLVRRILGQPVSGEILELLAQRSDGNPYFVEELLTWMAVNDVLVREDDGWALRRDGELDLPAAVEAAIQGRLDRLTAPQKELVKSVAVFGEVFWEEGCQALGIRDTAETLPELLTAEVLVRHKRSRIAGATEWAFRHNLVQRVAQRMLPAEARGRLHLAAAHWLEERGENDAAILAHHYREGGDQGRAGALYARAAEHAMSQGSPRQAVAWYRDALAGEVPADDAARRTLGLARAHYLLGEYDAAGELVEQQDRDAPLALERSVLRGQILFCRARYTEAEEVLATLPEVAEQVPPEWRFKASQTLFWVIWGQGRYADTGPVARELIELARQQGRPDYLCDAKLALAYYHVVEGDLSRSIALLEQAAEHARSLGDPYRELDSLILLGSSRELIGAYGGAADALEQARAGAERINSPHQLANAEIGLGRVQTLQGELDLALAHFQSAAQRARQLGDDRTWAMALAGAARARCGRGAVADRETARREATEALDKVAGRAPPVEAEARLALALIDLGDDNGPTAADQALAAVQLLDRLGTQERYETEILLAAHDALRLCGRDAEAGSMLARARQRLEARIARIRDPAVAASYRTRVPHNARVFAAPHLDT